MTSLAFAVCFSCLVSLICLVTTAPNSPSASRCLGSPVDLRSSVVGGRATTTLPAALTSLELTLQARRRDRNGAKILRLYPVMVDEKKCITEMRNLVHTCYEFSEIHWGKTDKEGSDHSISGHTYPMEIQHYFRRTNTTHSMSGLAVGVFVEINDRSRLDGVSSESLRPATKKGLGNQTAENQLRDQLGLFSSSTVLGEERLRLEIGSLLPNDIKERRFYQYRGSLSGTCTENMNWIVFEDPIAVPYLFLESLRSLTNTDDTNHFNTYQEHRCLLHSHYPSDINTCDAISPMTEAMYRDYSNTHKRLSFVAGDREPSERAGDEISLDSATAESDQMELGISSRSSVSSSSDWPSSPKLAGNRNVRSETNDSAKGLTTVSSAPVSTGNPGDLKPIEIAPKVTGAAGSISDSGNPSPVQTTRLSATQVPAGQVEVPSQTAPAANSTVILQPSVHTTVVSSAVVPSESPVLANERNKSQTSVVVISAPVGQGNAIRPQGNRKPSGPPETRDGSEPELVTSRDSIEDIRKGNSSVSPPDSHSVTASVRSLKPGLFVVFLGVLILYF